jgi:excisionase family DNA binding protein
MAGYPHLSEVLPQLATPDEIAPLLGLSPLGVVRQCRKGKLPALKVGSRWYIHVAKLAIQLDREAEQPKIA